MKFKIQLLEPAEEFLLKLENKLKAKAFRTIELLGEFGPELREPFSKKIQGYEGLFELRIKQGTNICRFFYFFEKDRVVILTSGYIKKEQKTSKDQLTKAFKLMKTYRGEQV
ncbi:type II toxin-antitoxin system RelE/ParE family toxin [Leptospira gomenensis]|uniref:Type II toxin-antitoxin system RelE/ParE family toxin n=1 Tax=Leptospira gomenensis TaxID=2484974 RepID=A0A5F1Z0W0_9LEPT|nr:type II toxin-antitoxin system RelE/ParE family toxin [Leptospira gomenensis]TGK30994.1 type II toxin-antitoxin system RelE/ParE family toxin [Leptospira gomenensis]TGK45286.1 type II toxin-antitoxin system RelE/ParE family toxin [Leptospira gomenensis]TGK66200.1 type II toxin-antitoxin system RelE/ParE family toxin [Leptospira gomenensis]